MVTKCKRYCESFIHTHETDHEVKRGYDGKLVSLCHRYELCATAEMKGEGDFGLHVTYIIPGWSAVSVPDKEAGDLCVLITTFNLALNFVCVTKWYNDRVTLTIDHTHKV